MLAKRKVASVGSHSNAWVPYLAATVGDISEMLYL